jgi:hypothetical protein
MAAGTGLVFFYRTGVMKSKRTGWAEHVARMGEKRNAYIVLVGKTEGKRLLGGIIS